VDQDQITADAPPVARSAIRTASIRFVPFAAGAAVKGDPR